MIVFYNTVSYRIIKSRGIYPAFGMQYRMKLLNEGGSSE